MLTSQSLILRATLAVVSVAVAAAGFTACGTTSGGSSAEPPPSVEACSPDADSILRTILQPSCDGAACHGVETGAIGLDLVSASPLDLVGKSSVTCPGWALVVPGSPESSFLYNKVTQDIPACGDHMPFMGDQLTPAQLDCIGQWITSLAADGCENCGGDACISLASDPANCGSCGNTCPAGTGCADGACQCPHGVELCGDVCLDTSTDPANCGGCGLACSPGASCAGGECQCPDPLVACSGTCVDLQANGDHCGQCDQGCVGMQVCLAGACSNGCGELTLCGAGCVDTATNTLHCGDCDNACPAGLPCVGGVCTCPMEGQTVCGGSCVDLTSDLDNCGDCGVACGAGETCVQGSCECTSSGMVTWAQVERLLDDNCTAAGCHTGVRPQAKMSLDAGKSYASIVNVKTDQCGGSRIRVKPGSPAQSYLLQKLMNVDICFGTQMPKIDMKLPQSEIEMISDWICSGAPN